MATVRIKLTDSITVEVPEGQVSSIERFRDTFTTSRYFARHKVLMIERVVDSVADSQTRHSDRIQAYLDGEEHILRRRIIRDWSQLCGP